MPLNESHVEAAATEWFQELGYAFVNGPEIAPGESAAERESFADAVLVGRLREAVERLNPQIPAEAQEETLRKVLRVGSPSLVATNRAFHQMLRDGVEVEYRRADIVVVLNGLPTAMLPGHNQSRSLADLGETRLPRIVSGQVQDQDAERFVGSYV